MAKFEGERDTLSGFLRDLDIRLTRQERHTHSRGGHGGGGGSTGLTVEEVFDLIGIAIEEGHGIDVTFNDAIDRVTIAVAGLTPADVGIGELAPLRRLVKNVTGATYTPILADENWMVTLSNATAITVTLPSNSSEPFPVAAEVDFLWLGAGQPTFVAGAGATVNGTPGLDLRAPYSAATAKKIATNAWVVIGDLSA